MPKEHEDQLLLRVSYLCAAQPCGVPVQFHFLHDTEITNNTQKELRDLLASGYWTGPSPCGHPIGVLGNQKVVFDIPNPGRPKGYNREDSFWYSTFEQDMNPAIILEWRERQRKKAVGRS